jgi:2-methylcitrate dehydratase
LAKNGVTGPRRIIEGSKGFSAGFLGGANQFEWVENKNEMAMMNTVIKSFCAEATSLGHIKATINLVSEHSLEASDVERVIIRTNKRTVEHLGDPIKKFPRTKENADHSSYFLTAMAILDREVTPRIYKNENYSDPRVHELINRTTLVHAPEFDNMTPGAEVILHTKDGRILHKTIYPSDLEGDPKNRMTFESAREKFLLCAEGLLDAHSVDLAIDFCSKFENARSLEPLMQALVIK